RHRCLRDGNALDSLGFSALEDFRPGGHLPCGYRPGGAHQRREAGGRFGHHGPDADAGHGGGGYGGVDVLYRHHRRGRYRQLGGRGALTEGGAVPWLARWVQDLIVVVFFASAAYLLLPENELRPYARLVMGLVVIAALLAPAVELLQWEPTLWAPRLAPAGEEAAALIADGRRMAAEAQRRVLDEGRARAEAHVAGVAELALGGPPAAVE